MTHPDTTPEKGDTPRVSAAAPIDDPIIAKAIDLALQSSLRLWGWMPLRDLAGAFRDARQSLATANARIAEMERERDQAREIANHGSTRTESEWETRGWSLADARARADRLAAENAELRTLGTRAEGMVAAAEIAEGARHPDYSAECEDWIEGTEFVARAIRAAANGARLAAPAEPVPETITQEERG